MFKFPSTKPSLSSKYEDWADYAEFLALKMGEIPFITMLKPALIESDEIEIDGIGDESDRQLAKVDEISGEINRRYMHSNRRYPFLATNHDYTIKHNVSDEVYFHVYNFLLFATRLNMTKDKVQAGIDGTHLFEKISALVALNFLGHNSKGGVFGTSNGDISGFRAKLEAVVNDLGEGGTIHARSGMMPQDDKIDIIVWKGFADSKKSQLIAFGQCKTGTSWQSSLTELNTEVFCHRWFMDQPAHMPIKMFFCAQYFNNEIWEGKAYSAGLIFDRFRIMEYLPDDLPEQLLNDIKNWNASAQALYDTNF